MLNVDRNSGASILGQGDWSHPLNLTQYGTKWRVSKGQDVPMLRYPHHAIPQWASLTIATQYIKFAYSRQSNVIHLPACLPASSGGVL